MINYKTNISIISCIFILMSCSLVDNTEHSAILKFRNNSKYMAIFSITLSNSLNDISPLSKYSIQVLPDEEKNQICKWVPGETSYMMGEISGSLDIDIEYLIHNNIYTSQTKLSLSENEKEHLLLLFCSPIKSSYSITEYNKLLLSQNDNIRVILNEHYRKSNDTIYLLDKPYFLENDPLYFSNLNTQLQNNGITNLSDEPYLYFDNGFLDSKFK
jgi:hypothetical protein